MTKAAQPQEENHVESVMFSIAVVLGVAAVLVIAVYGSMALSRQRRIQAAFRGVSGTRDTMDVRRVPKVDLAM
ncbi:hypothetical protein [Nocardia miyunensis]|uniref:hypothetical protein n=1 Tax=Nocardia miyunensis TaxID=282684 RepID=UPI0008313ED1|nr:hypothetical protein [Nocardia miyunensis]